MKLFFGVSILLIAATLATSSAHAQQTKFIDQTYRLKPPYVTQVLVGAPPLKTNKKDGFWFLRCDFSAQSPTHPELAIRVDVWSATANPPKLSVMVPDKEQKNSDDPDPNNNNNKQSDPVSLLVYNATASSIVVQDPQQIHMQCRRTDNVNGQIQQTACVGADQITAVVACYRFE